MYRTTSYITRRQSTALEAASLPPTSLLDNFRQYVYCYVNPLALLSSLRVHMCAHALVWGLHGHVCTNMESQRLISTLLFWGSTHWIWSSLSWIDLSASPQVSIWLCPSALGLQVHTAVSGFYVGAEGTNLYACVAGILQTEVSPQFSSFTS